MSELRTELQAALARLQRDGGTGNRLVVSRGPAWFALSAAAGDRRGRCVAATQKHLGDALKLTPESIIALRRADFAKARGERALSREVDLGSEDARSELAAQLLGWFETVFGLDADAAKTRVSVKLGDRPDLDNDHLHEAIRVLAKKRTPDARQAVYRALLQAELQLVVDLSGNPARLGELGGAATYAVFTSVAEADLWDPRGLNVQVAPGWSIFPRVAALSPGSLQINPSGRLGGELYRNELESLARACDRYRQ